MAPTKMEPSGSNFAWIKAEGPGVETETPAYRVSDMSSSSSLGLLPLHHPSSTPISKIKQQKTNLVRTGRSRCSIFPTSVSPPSPPPADPSLAVQQSGSRAAGPASSARKHRDGNGVGRREAIGLGVCLNAFAWLFRGDAVAEEGQCSLTVASSGLAFCDRVVGYGAAPSKGQLIKAHYVGKLDDGKVFDSSYARGRPLTFRVGVGEVIKGWDEGILGGAGIPPMLSGGKRTLKIPPELAYGVRGAGCKGGSCIIPPDSTLFFDVEFLGKA